MTETFEIAIVVGNPKPASRTLGVAERVARRVADALAVSDRASYQTFDLATFADQLFDWTSAEVRTTVSDVSQARLALVASPTYKAAYTGILKAYLDWFDERALDGVVAIPVMVGGTPRHSLAVELHLRPVLIEIGAVVPTRGLFVLEEELGQLDVVLDSWLERAAIPLARATGLDPLAFGRG